MLSPDMDCGTWLSGRVTRRRGACDSRAHAHYRSLSQGTSVVHRNPDHDLPPGRDFITMADTEESAQNLLVHPLFPELETHSSRYPSLVERAQVTYSLWNASCPHRLVLTGLSICLLYLHW